MSPLPQDWRPIRIGTRGSPLALAQALSVRDLIIDAYGVDATEFEIIPIKTSGDRLTEQPLSEWGGKGLFTKEIEEALLAGNIDIAVHSVKDMPNQFPDGLCLAAVLPRADARDAFISLTHPSLDHLPQGAAVGTSSLRRQAQILAKRPDLQVIPFRGNVGTRLKKLQDGQAQATFLAMAGLRRLGLHNIVAYPLELSNMLPAVGQGVIGIECRTDNAAMRDMLDALHHPQTLTCLMAERQFLAVLDGSCRTPIAGHAQLIDGKLHFNGEILNPDGTNRRAIARVGEAVDAYAIGQECGLILKGK